MGQEYDYALLRHVGEDVFISADVEIRRPHLVSVGSHVAIDTGFYCTVEATIGDYTHIGPHVTVIGGANAKLVMAAFNTVAAGCRIVCASDEFMGAGIVGMAPVPYRDNIKNLPVAFEAFASIGTNVVVHPGVTLREGSVVGSCSLVTRDTEPWTICYGVPAKAIKPRERDRMLGFAKELGYDV